MKRWKSVFTIVLCCILLMFNVESIFAAFPLNATAVYDANTGILMIYDNQFTPGDSEGYYSAYPTLMNIGGVALNGSYEFGNGYAKIFVSNKAVVNQQNGFDTNSSASLYLNERAIAYNKYAGINVVTSSYSNASSPSLSVTMIKPRLKVDAFYADKTALSANGGYVNVTVSGSNLNIADLSVLDTTTSMLYSLPKENASANVQINLPANDSQSPRTNTFILLINSNDSGFAVSVTTAEKINQGGGSTTKPDNGNSTTTPPSNNDNTSNDTSTPNTPSSDKGNSNNNNSNNGNNSSSNNSNGDASTSTDKSEGFFNKISNASNKIDKKKEGLFSNPENQTIENEEEDLSEDEEKEEGIEKKPIKKDNSTNNNERNLEVESEIGTYIIVGVFVLGAVGYILYKKEIIKFHKKK